MTCNLAAHCSLCELPDGWRRWRKWNEPPPKELAYRSNGRLVLDGERQPDGALRPVLGSEKAQNPEVRLCQGCLERALGHGRPR